MAPVTKLNFNETKPPLIQIQINKVAPKCKIPEVKTLLSRMEQDIISETLQKK